MGGGFAETGSSDPLHVTIRSMTQHQPADADESRSATIPSAHTVEELEGKLMAARAQLAATLRLKDRHAAEVQLLEERIVRQQLTDALADGGPAEVLRWWTRGHRNTSRLYVRRAMNAWLQGLCPQLWCPDQPPSTNPRHTVGTFNIAWNVSVTTQEETATLAGTFNSIGLAVRSAQVTDRTFPEMNIQAIPPCAELRFGSLREPCVILRLTPEGWELVTASNTHIMLGSTVEDCCALLVQAQATALSRHDNERP
ncbi:hypothetical protein [Streptomyces sp. NPDC051572]|uniref:hypothetical protein n=1 Tax=Streptomyces sp. NPDC051572 TaxID=3155802 RepID=UPI00344D1A9C